ncbi:hypothetical protein GUJ93_ZPchr0007g3517 [Zizania palustris]|uniref:Uncharacterized protein n=1 Tax=Zizania palustris TaxID=103762 RepID=A0A8J5TEJ9_ZIZPA|nr:hypothetical protein GUJ93_ZPchr0007g3517 [Zizania palustris]
MGNCGASQRGVESWTDDGEWEEEEEHRERKEHVVEAVTIRITKRQLHELMEGKAGRDSRGKSRRSKSTHQLLADIMNSGEVHHHVDHREAHWKPALQSIPEAVDS